jgi:predicted RNA-binding Zn-ribbon protein involved in translation (DUF1610 family)
MLSIALRQEIESTFHVVKDRCTRDEVVFLCPECGDTTGNRSVNMRTGLTFCWRCNKGNSNRGKFISWAFSLGYRFNNTENTNSITFEQMLSTLEQPVKERVPLLHPVRLPAGFTRLTEEPDCAYSTLIERMAVRKNLSFDDFARVGAGFTFRDPKWEAFCIFPVVEFDTVVYYQGRTYVDVPGESTKMFPNRKEVPYGASYWVYNLDQLRKSRAETVLVVESILNVLSLKRRFRELGWKNVVPVCVFKHSISRVQMMKLYRYNVREICVLFDHDAIDKTWRAGSSTMVRMTVAEMPAGTDNKKLDPNDDVDAAIEAFEKRKPVSVVNFINGSFMRVNGEDKKTNLRGKRFV